MSTTLASDPARAAAVFQALSDGKRLRILELLGSGERCVCELVEALDLSQSLLSFHLKTLKEAGLVADRRDGRWVHYSRVPGAFTEARQLLEGLSSEAPVRVASDRSMLTRGRIDV